MLTPANGNWSHGPRDLERRLAETWPARLAHSRFMGRVIDWRRTQPSTQHPVAPAEPYSERETCDNLLDWIGAFVQPPAPGDPFLRRLQTGTAYL